MSLSFFKYRSMVSNSNLCVFYFFLIDFSSCMSSWWWCWFVWIHSTHFNLWLHLCLSIIRKQVRICIWVIIPDIFIWNIFSLVCIVSLRALGFLLPRKKTAGCALSEQVQFLYWSDESCVPVTPVSRWLGDCYWYVDNLWGCQQELSELLFWSLFSQSWPFHFAFSLIWSKVRHCE